jgi:hypothetical protein
MTGVFKERGKGNPAVLFHRRRARCEAGSYAATRSEEGDSARLTDQSFTCTPASQTMQRRGAAVAATNTRVAGAICN